jgi:hypothetical protein
VRVRVQELDIIFGQADTHLHTLDTTLSITKVAMSTSIADRPRSPPLRDAESSCPWQVSGAG